MVSVRVRIMNIIRLTVKAINSAFDRYLILALRLKYGIRPKHGNIVDQV